MSQETMRQLVRRVQTESGSVDPREIAEKVLAALDGRDPREALAEVLPEFVRQCMTASRRSLLATPLPNRSAKVAAVRSWVERILAESVDVSGEGGQWKALRDCTRDDLLAVAGFRREMAARNVATAERYEALAAALGDGQTVGQLSGDVIAATFGRAAA